MSLWSPVDLVSGGTGKTNSNLTINPLNSQQFRSAKREDKFPQNYTSSLLYDHLLRRSSSKLNDNKNVISKDLNAAINRVVMYSNDTSSGLQNLKKKQSIKGLRVEPESHNSVTEEAIPLLKQKFSDEVNENCDKYKRIKNSNTMSNNEEEDSVMPLDLCVKRVKNESGDISSRGNSLFNKSNTSLVHNNASTAINTPQYNPSSHSSRKRGRKPKSLLAATSDLMVASNLASLSNLIDTKPRKRGRPPTLSPPLSSFCGQQPLAAHSSNLNKAVSSSGAFQSHFPYAVLNTPLQPGWPSLSSTGQLIFPDKLNGNDMNSFKLNKISANVSESSDNLDSLASDSDSNEDESDCGSQTTANKTSKFQKVCDSQSGERINENELRIPLQFGWRRETKITKINKSGIEGEVFYYSPCARRFKNHNEIFKYLTKNGITNISRNHFSFNPKPIVGNYIQKLHNSGTEILLSEKEVRKEFETLRRTAISSEKKRKSSNESDIQSKEMQLRLLMESTRMATRDAKRTKFDDIKSIRENEMSLNPEERLGLMHLEKISKTHRIEENRKKRREDLEKQRQEEMVRKVQERELKRQQLELMREQDMQRRRELLIMADLERERRRQHMMLVRALEAHKKQEEKERKKEEILAERLRIQEKKIQKKRIETELLRELKKPIDDMMIKDLNPLPTLNRIPGLKLPGKAFADTLMVFEFLHNFGETLGFDMESLPTLNTLTMALLNIDESAEEELLSVIHHLLVCAIEDPGIPVNVTTIMGQKLKDAAITNYNITEILRLYFQSFDSNIRDDAKEHRIESRISLLLQNACPFLSLNATQKAEILAFLCNELLCNQTIVKQVEENIETVGVIRRDKWLLENDLRKWKTIKMKREKKNSELIEERKIEVETGEDDSADSDSEETQNNSVVSTNESEEEPGLTNEEIDKKIDKLNKQFNQINNKLNKATNMYRVSALGQDRYRRRYWVLPNAGGVFVEGIESGEVEELLNNIWTQEDKEKIRPHTDCKNSETIDEKEDNSEVTIKDGLETSEESSKPIDCKVVGDDHDQTEEEKCDKNVMNSGDDFDESENIIKKEIDSNVESKINEEMEEIKKESKTESDDKNNGNIVSDSEPKNDSIIESKIDTKVTPKKSKVNDEGNTPLNDSSIQSDNWMSPFFASVLAGSLMLNNGTTGGSNNGLSSQLPLSFPFGLDMSHNSSQNKSNGSDKIWFSVLPRIPCDQTLSDSESVKSEDLNQINVNKVSEKSTEVNLSSQQQKLLQQSPISSLMNGLPSNLFMQAFLYPHILSSLFNQHSLGGGPCPPDTSPFSFGPTPSTKTTINCKQNGDSVDSESQESTKQMTNLSNSDVLLDSELDICPSLQKRIAQQRDEQFDRPQKIPNEYQFGWWRITDSSQLKVLLEVLSTRGVRERQLQKHLQKYINYASLSCKSNVAELDITDMDRHISENCAFGAPTQGKCPHDICADNEWCREVALRFDIAVLEQIEALEEKIATSSMQIRNWKPLPRISSNKSMKFKAAADFVINQELKSEDYGAMVTDNSLDNPEETESHNESEQMVTKSGEINPVIVGRERLLVLENVIERRYLKPPLGFKSNTILVSNNNSDVGQMDDYNDNAADENATSGLLRWRDAVREAKCSAEIAYCLHFLESCIAWDKSIMRASCQFCGSGENEAQLLLCDGCDKGYHMYCFKPKMEAIPEGDWFCFECQNKNTIDKVCVVCGKKGKLLNCDSCAKVFHPNCLDPPVTKPLKGKWICHMCCRKPKKPNLQKTSKKSSNISSEEKLMETINNTSIAFNNSSTNNSNKETLTKRLSNGTNKSDKESKKEKKSKQSDKCQEMNNCKIILDQMENHEHCWPFLLPVNTKQFPTYKKIIKKPMDTTTIRSKLDCSSYKNKEEFGLDVRLIFDNCVTFNEDESPVGQAGHQLRAFFEAKWKELFGS